MIEINEEEEDAVSIICMRLTLVLANVVKGAARTISNCMGPAEVPVQAQSFDDVLGFGAVSKSARGSECAPAVALTRPVEQASVLPHATDPRAISSQHLPEDRP